MWKQFSEGWTEQVQKEAFKWRSTEAKESDKWRSKTIEVNIDPESNWAVVNKIEEINS